MGSEKSEAAHGRFRFRRPTRTGGSPASPRRRGRSRRWPRPGPAEIRLLIGDGAPLAPAHDRGYRAAARRRGGGGRARRGPGPAPCPPRWEIVRATGKPGDGLVSRWLNRPISQRITLARARHPRRAADSRHHRSTPCWRWSWSRSCCSAARRGSMLGGILFQAASILDGVDGEMARATFRTSTAGATMDSAVDIATNLLFVSALTVHLALRDHDVIGWIGGWAVTLSILGGMLIALAGARRRRPARLRPAQALGPDPQPRRSRLLGGADADQPRLLRLPLHGADHRRAGADRADASMPGSARSGSSMCSPRCCCPGRARVSAMQHRLLTSPEIVTSI